MRCGWWSWRGLAGFQGRGSVRSWLYAIVTNSAVDLTRHRSRRELPVAFGPSADPGADLDPPLTDQPWLDPYPDDWLTREARLSPEARYEQRESVELAFLVALQHLPALQRAVLLLREVVGFSTAEIAGQLGTTAAAVNSALQRARAAIRRRLPAASQQSALRAQGDERTRALVQRYADAIERGDADTLISMLTADATWSMPPAPTWYRGHQAVRKFLVSAPLTYQWRHVPTSANGQLAVGCYLFDHAKGRYVPAVIDVLTLDGDKIAAVTGFLAAELDTELPQPAPHSGRATWVTGTELFCSVCPSNSPENVWPHRLASTRSTMPIPAIGKSRRMRADSRGSARSTLNRHYTTGRPPDPLLARAMNQHILPRHNTENENGLIDALRRSSERPGTPYRIPAEVTAVAKFRSDT
jgi:RNA polymerase sigma-70 factor, ECF subfamily